MKNFSTKHFFQKSFLSFLLTLLLLTFSSLAYGLSPEKRLENDAQESRAMKLFLQVRCLVCSGQVIENSDTQFAFEMRQLIRQKIVNGDDDQKIKDDLVKKFGNDILNEPTSITKIFLWILPIFFATLGLIYLIWSGLFAKK